MNCIIGSAFLEDLLFIFIRLLIHLPIIIIMGIEVEVSSLYNVFSETTWFGKGF